MTKPTPLRLDWTGTHLVLERDGQQVRMSPAEFDELCHWAMQVGLLPMLASEVRQLREWIT